MWIGLRSRVADSRYWSLRSTYRRLWHPYCSERCHRRNIVVCIEQNTTILELECSLINADALQRLAFVSSHLSIFAISHKFLDDFGTGVQRALCLRQCASQPGQRGSVSISRLMRDNVYQAEKINTALWSSQ